MSRTLRHGALIFVAAALWASGAGAGSMRAPELTVLAASSLTDVFPAIDQSEHYSFAGSNMLATQLENGAPADLFASANTTLPAQLFAARVVEKPVDFTRNRLVLVVPKANPAGIRSVRDLTKSGVTVDIANSGVPVGAYTLEVLDKLSLRSKVLANVVSEETDVRAVLTKVALGQVDAGFVYATDAKTVSTEVKVLPLPVSAEPNVTYAIAVVTKSLHQAAAQAFVKKLLSKAGQAKLAAYGFLPLPKP